MQSRLVFMLSEDLWMLAYHLQGQIGSGFSL